MDFLINNTIIYYKYFDHLNFVAHFYFYLFDPKLIIRFYK